jgi:hypothetical protein
MAQVRCFRPVVTVGFVAPPSERNSTVMSLPVTAVTMPAMPRYCQSSLSVALRFAKSLAGMTMMRRASVERAAVVTSVRSPTATSVTLIVSALLRSVWPGATFFVMNRAADLYPDGLARLSAWAISRGIKGAD